MLTSRCNIMIMMAGMVMAVPSPYIGRPDKHHLPTPTVHSNATQVQRQFAPPYTPFVPGDDPHREDHLEQLSDAWKDAIKLPALSYAAFGHSYPPVSEDVFERYFETDNDEFVNAVYGAVATYNNPDNLDLSKLDNLRKVVEAGGVTYSTKFSQLTLSYGDHPTVPEDRKSCKKALDPDHPWDVYAYIWQLEGSDNKAIICLCDLAAKFPKLDAIEQDTPATWKAGPGCDGLGTEDSGWMTSLGGHLVHELTHWDYQLRDIPGYEDVVKNTPDQLIGDYNYDYWTEYVEDDEEFPKDPLSGYGPYRTWDLNHATETRNLGQRNADNYRWYAQSRYWSYTCKKDFNHQDDYTGKQGDNLRWRLDH